MTAARAPHRNKSSLIPASSEKEEKTTSSKLFSNQHTEAACGTIREADSVAPWPGDVKITAEFCLSAEA